MSDPSRRGFLAIAGVGAAGVAAATVVGASSASAQETKSTSEDVKLPHGASGSIVAYVSNVHDGQLSVMVGERAVVVNDKDLVARLAHVAAK